MPLNTLVIRGVDAYARVAKVLGLPPFKNPPKRIVFKGKATRDWALAELAKAFDPKQPQNVKKDFNPNEARDEAGKWTVGGQKVWMDIRDSHRGDHYGSVYADTPPAMATPSQVKADNIRVGRLDFAGNDARVSIQHIETHPDFRRMGVATRMLDKLHEEFPKAEVNWGMMTPDGVKLHEAVVGPVEAHDEAALQHSLEFKEGFWGEAAPQAFKDEVRARAEAVAKSEGFPLDKIEIVDNPPKPEPKPEGERTYRDKDRFTTLGLAHAVSGSIKLYPAVFIRAAQAQTNKKVKDSVEGTIAHEIQHQKTNLWLRDAAAESKALDEEKAKLPPDKLVQDGYIHNTDGTLVKEWADKYPLLAERKVLLDVPLQKLAKSDGVTPYSKSFWQMQRYRIKGDKYGPSIVTTISETLSEMAARKVASTRLSGSPGWKALYKAIDTHWRKTPPEKRLPQPEVTKFVKYSDDQARDYHGRWTVGGGTEFVSPNVGNLNFTQAQIALQSPEQERTLKALADVDKLMGLDTKTTNAIGAWKDGAENSTIGVVQHASWDQLKTAGAMKGYLSNQKAVLVFQPGTGKQFLANFEAKGSVEEIHKRMLASGLEFHTLEPTGAGARVHVFGFDQETVDKVRKVANDEGSKPEVFPGHGEFVGTSKEDGTDAEQRADARQKYEGVIGLSGVHGAQAGWQRLRDNRSAPPKDKPVVMVFGGSFNPPHMGHVGAVRDAVNHLTEQGYHVAKTIVVPSADKLISRKLEDRAYPLEDRVNLTRMAFHGIPNVEVSGKPAEEAERTEGKLRRTQLTDWARKEHPGSTVIAVTGQDAAPGEHVPRGPAVYKGDPGTPHEGYDYLVMPREETGGMRSSPIRTAIREGTEPPPGWLAPGTMEYIHGMFAKNPKLKKYSPEQDRDYHGRWTDTGTQPDSGQLQHTTDEWRKALRQRIDQAAVREGFPPERIDFATKNKMFTLNDKEFPYAGESDRNRGRIIFYPDAIRDDGKRPYGNRVWGSPEQYVAHEVMHQKFDYYQHALAIETQALQARLDSIPPMSDRKAWPNRTDYPLAPAGYLRNGWEKDFPLYDWHERNVSMKWDELHTKDGVTPYSKEWWQSATTGKGTPLYNAYTETLAEMASARAQSRRSRAPGAKVWQTYYNKVNQVWKEAPEHSRFGYTRQLAVIKDKAA